ncbi:MAG TPA: tetratricopeptide repeat protein, partial [Spirochaetes bacterium]|nr:tetratricopeptide repeat protein [Spirochaetota bacterium]
MIRSSKYPLNKVLLVCLFLLPIMGFSDLKTHDDYEKAALDSFNLGKYKKVINLCDKGMDIRGNSVSLINLKGQSQFLLRQYNESQLNFKKLLVLANKTKDPMTYALYYNNMGEIHRVQGQLDKALGLYKKALALNRGGKNLLGEAINYHNMGKVFRTQGNLKKAINYFQQSIELKVKEKDRFGAALSYNELGLVYESKKTYKKALTYYKESEKLLRATRSVYYLGMVMGNIGRIHFLRKNYDEALRELQKALGIAERIEDFRGLSTRCIHLSMVYVKLSNYHLALT